LSFRAIAMEIGELVEQKNAAYGSSFSKTGQFLRLLYPEGLRPEQFDDALLQVRIFDKQMRIATNRDAFGESPYRDIVGYGILGASLQRSKGTKGSDTASAAMPEAGMHPVREGQDSQVLQRSLPRSRPARNKAKHEGRKLPALRQKPQKAKRKAAQEGAQQ